MDLERWSMLHRPLDGWCMKSDPYGMFVLHSDHIAAMQAKDEEIAALRARLENAIEWEEMTDVAEFGFGELLLVKTRDKYGDTRTRYMTAQYYPRDDARMTPYERFCSKHCYARKSISHFARMKEPR